LPSFYFESIKAHIFAPHDGRRNLGLEFLELNVWVLHLDSHLLLRIVPGDRDVTSFSIIPDEMRNNPLSPKILPPKRYLHAPLLVAGQVVLSPRGEDLGEYTTLRGHVVKYNGFKGKRLKGHNRMKAASSMKLVYLSGYRRPIRITLPP
jgi:hypothetical protein